MESRRSPKLIIKAHTGIGMGAHISAAKQILIEEYVLLGRNVHISDHTHAFENIQTPIIQQGINGIAPVSIGRGTWLGQNVVVLPGVTIGGIVSSARIQWSNHPFLIFPWRSAHRRGLSIGMTQKQAGGRKLKLIDKFGERFFKNIQLSF